MVDRHDTMMNPPIEGLLTLAGSKFRLVTVASMRARQINSYFGQLGDGLGAMVPPQVTSLARKPLSIAFEEIDAGKIVAVDRVSEEVRDADPEDAFLLESAPSDPGLPAGGQDEITDPGTESPN